MRITRRAAVAAVCMSAYLISCGNGDRRHSSPSTARVESCMRAAGASIAAKAADVSPFLADEALGRADTDAAYGVVGFAVTEWVPSSGSSSAPKAYRVWLVQTTGGNQLTGQQLIDRGGDAGFVAYLHGQSSKVIRRARGCFGRSPSASGETTSRALYGSDASPSSALKCESGSGAPDIGARRDRRCGA